MKITYVLAAHGMDGFSDTVDCSGGKCLGVRVASSSSKVWKPGLRLEAYGGHWEKALRKHAPRAVATEIAERIKWCKVRTERRGFKHVVKIFKHGFEQVKGVSEHMIVV